MKQPLDYHIKTIDMLIGIFKRSGGKMAVNYIRIYKIEKLKEKI
jgi:hypothetical protein